MEEFRMARAFSVATVVRLFLPSVLLIPIWLVFIAFIPDRLIELVFLAAGATVVFAGVRLVRWRQAAAATVARLSSEDVEMEDWYGSRVRLAWRNVERIDVVESRIPSPRTITRAGRIDVRTGARQCIGLVGWGEHEIPHNAPNWLLAHRARLPIDPATGLQRISIPLGVVDPLWEHGPMGAQVRQHRPDLFQSTVAPGTHSASRTGEEPVSP
ncbi:hypothetical protein [Nonomuraea jiangxiensis]|uniref:hypothetical protein n=1 Tax=Nonomuraea jiangxiensis TaxID=633440 RepID=UPI000B8A479E|nr:hypothetical protein [Nonomuraea jiangxiensis]